MTYTSVAAIQRDGKIRDRVSACVAVEGISESPDQWAADHSWALAARPGWAEAWDASAAAEHGDSYAPGYDPSVISDAMILDAVLSLSGRSPDVL